MTVKRYSPAIEWIGPEVGGEPLADMFEREDGDYVSYEDFLKLLELLQATELIAANAKRETAAILSAAGTAKFAVDGSVVKCTQSGIVNLQGYEVHHEPVMDDDSSEDENARDFPYGYEFEKVTSFSLGDGEGEFGNGPYVSLSKVLQAAYDQAAKGKGKERHAMGQPFTAQPMQTISKLLHSDAGMAFQAMKKIQEGLRMEGEARERELLGAINYIAGIIVYHRGEQQ